MPAAARVACELPYNAYNVWREIFVVRTPAACSRLVQCLALTGFALLLLPGTSRAESGRAEGLFITIGAADRSITSQEKDRIADTVRQAIQRFRNDESRRDAGAEKRLFKIVFDFNPDGHNNSSTDFGACYDLAKFLRRLDDDIVTIAFVHGTVSEHSVLPVLACHMIVMSNGEGVGLGEVSTADEFERLYYSRVLKDRHRSALAPAMRLLDPKTRVRRVYLLPSTPVWVDADAVPAGAGELAEVIIDGKATKVRIDPKDTAEDPFAAGMSNFSVERAVKFGLCQRTAESRADVAWIFDLPPSSLRGDPLLGRTPRPWRIDVKGAVTADRVQSYERQIKYARGKGANLIIIRLRDCGAGDFTRAIDFAHYLRELKDDDDRPITTVAYVSGDAPDTATIVALGCSSIIMRQGATIGDFHSPQFVEPDAARNQPRITALRDLAQKQGYAASLIDGMMNAEVRLGKVEDRHGDAREWRVLTESEWQKEARWKLIEEIKPPGKLLVLTADKARDLNLAQEVLIADEDDVGPLYKYLGVRKEDVQSSENDWLDKIADFLRSEVVSVLLVMIGIICLILEFKLPGATVPIVIAALCFVLFFWAHSQLSGQFPWLAVLLFVLGLIFLALEVFVFPGSVVMGISGLAAILVSLALVTIEHKPESARDWFEFGKTLTIFGGAVLAAIAIALFMASHIQQIPILNRLVLHPGGEIAEDDIHAMSAPREANLSGLLGEVGVAATPLRPAGKVQFGEEYVDVVAESGYIAPGTRVQVVEVEGIRVVVKEV
jgi:membrane-bound serine protease (ClpP class)